MFKSDINEVKDRIKAWWDFEDIGRPCLQIKVLKDPKLIPDTEDLNEFWTDENFIIKREMALIDNTTWMGEAIPYHYVNFGSVPLGGCLGGRLEFVDKETTWNKPFIKNIEEILDLDVGSDNKWWKLITNITTKSAEIAHNHHYVSYVALSGITDIISMVFGMEELLYEFIDNPEGVKRVINYLIPVWKRLFNQLDAVIKESKNEGNIGWAGVWAPGTTFPLQEDLSFMLSNEMFNEFCLTSVENLIDFLDCPFYHLDGKGAIKFVDTLTSIKKLKAIQWVPGAGSEELSQWHDLIKYILSKGKSMQIFAKADEVEPLVKAVGTRGLLITVNCDSVEKAERLMEKYKRV
jgi:hypothetical protein